MALLVRRRSDRIVIYTAIYGGYDSLAPQPELDGVEWVCFTDNVEITATPPWTIRFEPGRSEYPRLSAKWFTTHPHRAIGEYQRTIWIDGSIRVTSPTFVRELLHILVDRPLANFPHPDPRQRFSTRPTFRRRCRGTRGFPCSSRSSTTAARVSQGPSFARAECSFATVLIGGCGGSTRPGWGSAFAGPIRTS